MTNTNFESPRHVLAEGTSGVKHSHHDLTTHICAIKQWQQVGSGPNAGAIIDREGRIRARNFQALVDHAIAEGWIRDHQNSRHIYWELI